MRSLFLAGLILMCFLPRSAGQVVRTSEVLAGARNDLRVQQSEMLANAASQLRFHLPLLREVELRAGFRGSVLGDTIYGYLRNEDVYGLIISPNSLRVIKSQRAFQGAQVQVYAAQKQMHLEEALLLRYLALVNGYYSLKQASARKTLLDLFSKKQELLRISAEQGLEIRVKDVIATEDDRLKAMNAWMEAQQQYLMRMNEIAQFLGAAGTVSIDTSDFVSVEKIAHRLQSIPATPAISPETMYRERVSALAQARLRYHTAQNRQVINDLRFTYDYPLYLTRPNRFNTFNNFSVRIGLTLPLPGNNNFRSSSAMLDLHEARFSAQRTAHTAQAEAALERSRLPHLLEFFYHCRRLEQESLIPGMLANPALRDLLTPLERIEMEISSRQLALRTLDAARDITLSYVLLLHNSGLLSREPLLNWLNEQEETW